MLIFGWGHQTNKNIGIAFKSLCSHCHNEDYWVLTKITTWFTLFFIPVIPYSIKHFLSCPVCKYGLILDSKQIEQIVPIAEANQLLIDGKITQEQHQAQLKQINLTSPDPAQTEVMETEKLVSANKDLIYCGSCGTTITKELKFCGNCGTAVTSE